MGEVGDEAGPQHPLALQRHGPLEGHEHQTQQRDTDEHLGPGEHGEHQRGGQQRHRGAATAGGGALEIAVMPPFWTPNL